MTTAVTTASEPHEVETIELHTRLSSTTDKDDEVGAGDDEREPDAVEGADDGPTDPDGSRNGQAVSVSGSGAHRPGPGCSTTAPISPEGCATTTTSVREAVSAPRLRDPVDRDVAGLDGDARLRAVLHQTGQLEELSELDASGH